MKTLKKNQSGFGGVEALLVLVIVAIVGAVGWYVWHVHSTNKTTPASTTTTTPTSVATTTKPKTVDPYAGWKNYTTVHQKLSFKYPTNWAVSDDSSSNNNNDFITIKSPDGFSITFQALEPVGASSSESALVSTNKVSFNSQSDHLLYFSSQATLNNAKSGPVDLLALSTQADKIVLPKVSGSNVLVWDITMSPKTPIATAELQSNADLKTAQLIIKSTSY